MVPLVIQWAGTSSTATATTATVQNSSPAGSAVGDWAGDALVVYVSCSIAGDVSSGAGAVDIISLYWNGTNYYGQASLDFS